MSAPRYTRTAILLHWVQAALDLTLLGLGWYMADLPKGPDKTATYALHKSLGLCALALVAVRLLWRWQHRPAPLARVTPQERLATAVHHLLYLLLALVPLAGYLSASFTKYPMKLFGMPVFKAGWADETINGMFNALHKGSALILAILVGLHVAAALYHGLRRDGVLARMSPHNPRAGTALE